MTPKQVICLRLLLRTLVFLCAIGVLVREISWRRADQTEHSQLNVGGPDAHHYTAVAFDTQCDFVLTGDSQKTDQAATQVVKLLNDLHLTLNRYDESSELARFNQMPANEPFHCSELLWKAFLAARDAHESTEGIFDVTIGPLMKFWRQTASGDLQVIDYQQLNEIKKAVGFERLKFDDAERSVTKCAPGMSVDFGGLAKGLALDLVRELLAEYHFSRVFLDFGGNLYLSNPPDLPRAGEVLIRDPRAGDHTAGKMLGRMLDGNGRCIATSANSERPLATGSNPIGHIMDPRTGQPATKLTQVTAVTPRGVDSDVFSTAVFIAGAELAERLADTIPDTGFILLSPAEEATPQVVGHATFEPLLSGKNP